MLVERGARVWVEFYTPEVDLQSGDVPVGFTGRCTGSALIDTGATIGAVDAFVVEQLRLIRCVRSKCVRPAVDTKRARIWSV
jgi:hypothetical protein